MPRPIRSQGRPGTRVIPVDWSNTHRPVVAKTFGATVAIRRPGGIKAAFDPAIGQSPTVPYAPHFTGPARVEVLPRLGAQDLVIAGMEVATFGYRVSVGVDAPVEPLDGSTVVGNLVHITGVDANGDSSLVGRDLFVLSIARASTVWERHLVCTDKVNGGAPA